MQQLYRGAAALVALAQAREDRELIYPHLDERNPSYGVPSLVGARLERLDAASDRPFYDALRRYADNRRHYPLRLIHCAAPSALVRQERSQLSASTACFKRRVAAGRCGGDGRRSGPGLNRPRDCRSCTALIVFRALFPSN